MINLGYFFVLFGAFVIVGAGNAVNLTDGLDGLAIVPVMIAAATFGVIAYLAGNAVFANYLQINFVPGTVSLPLSSARSSARASASCGSTRRLPPSSWAIRVHWRSAA